jgi:uncharacterized protein YuzE
VTSAIRARATDPDGQEVVLDDEAWQHVRAEHPEMKAYQSEVMQAVTSPTHRRPDPRPGRIRYFRQGLGPSQWMFVVVDFNVDPTRCHSLWHAADSALTESDTPMSITIGQFTFDHVDYDRSGDVLYLHMGEPQPGEENEETPEGHALRFNSEGALVGVTILNAKWLLDQGKPIAITMPALVDVDPSTVASAVNAA